MFLSYANTGPVSIQVKDAKLIPIVEIEMHSPSVIATTCGEVTKSHFSLDVSLWSYNSMLKAWEPMLESTQLVMHYDHNSSGKVNFSVWNLASPFNTKTTNYNSICAPEIKLEHTMHRSTPAPILLWLRGIDSFMFATHSITAGLHVQWHGNSKFNLGSLVFRFPRLVFQS